MNKKNCERMFRRAFEKAGMGMKGDSDARREYKIRRDNRRDKSYMDFEKQMNDYEDFVAGAGKYSDMYHKSGLNIKEKNLPSDYRLLETDNVYVMCNYLLHKPSLINFAYMKWKTPINDLDEFRGRYEELCLLCSKYDPSVRHQTFANEEVYSFVLNDTSDEVVKRVEKWVMKEEIDILNRILLEKDYGFKINEDETWYFQREFKAISNGHFFIWNEHVFNHKTYFDCDYFVKKLNYFPYKYDDSGNLIPVDYSRMPYQLVKYFYKGIKPNKAKLLEWVNHFELLKNKCMYHSD